MDETQKATLKNYLRRVAEGSAAKRAMAVLLLDSGGDVTLTGYAPKHAQRLRRDYKRMGTATFEDKRKSNRDRILTRTERTQVVTTLQNKQPKEVIPGCSDEHWSTYWLGRHIHELTGKKYKSKTSHYLLFKEARLSFHLPGKRYEKADKARTTDWVKQQMDGRSRLMRAWNDPEAVVLCEDEMVLTSATSGCLCVPTHRSQRPTARNNAEVSTGS